MIVKSQNINITPIYPDEGGDGDGAGGEGDGVAVQQGQHDPCSGVEQD